MKTKTYYAELHRWPNGSYGLVVEAEKQPQALEPVASFEVTETSKEKVAGRVIAHLLGQDNSHAVWRVK